MNYFYEFSNDMEAADILLQRGYERQAGKLLSSALEGYLLGVAEDKDVDVSYYECTQDLMDEVLSNKVKTDMFDKELSVPEFRDEIIKLTQDITKKMYTY